MFRTEFFKSIAYFNHSAKEEVRTIHITLIKATICTVRNKAYLYRSRA